jgi:phosphatidylinositol alpha-mannosyltransferase
MKYKESEKSRWYKIANGKRVVLFFGFIAPRKGLDVLISAFSKVLLREKNVVLILAGGIRKEYLWYYRWLKKEIKKHYLSQYVLFTGYVPSEEIAQLYSMADVIVLPYTYPVGNSSPAMYAIQFEKPIIATAIFPFIDEFKNNVDAILIEPFNSEDLASAIIELLQNNELRFNLSKNIKKKKINRDWKSIAEVVFKKVYMEVGHAQGDFI